MYGIVSSSLSCGDLQQQVSISESKFGPFTRLVEAPVYLISRTEKEVAASLSLKTNIIIIIIIIKRISYSIMTIEMKAN
jgi:hypothetical protein